MSLAKLHAPAYLKAFEKQAGQAKAKNVARQFEEILLKSLVHSMRQSAKHKSEGMLNAGNDVVQDMFESELARSLAKSGTLGIAEMLQKRSAQLPDQLNDLSNKINKLKSGVSKSLHSAGPLLGLRAQRALNIINKLVPGARLSSDYGQRRDPITGEPGHFHRGLDLAAPLGSPVRSFAAGTIIRSKHTGGLGLAVYIDHGDGRISRYGHLSTSEVQLGQKVAAGEKIGQVGSSGRSTGPHLHFELRVAGQAVDPLK